MIWTSTWPAAMPVCALAGKAPEPGALVGDGGGGDQAEIDLARARYTQWINRILGDERDITEILFLDENGSSASGWSARAAAAMAADHAAPARRAARPGALLLSGRLSNVVLSPLRIDLTANDPAWVFTLQLLSPIVSATAGEPPIGLVAITLDIAGLVRRDAKMLWVHDDGRYLRLPDQPDVPVVRATRSMTTRGWKGTLGANRVVLREKGTGGRSGCRCSARWMVARCGWGAPWMTSRCRSSVPEIVLRVLLIVLGLVMLQFVVARWITRRAERFSRDLTEGAEDLESDQPVVFNWSGRASCDSSPPT